MLYSARWPLAAISTLHPPPDFNFMRREPHEQGGRASSTPRREPARRLKGWRLARTHKSLDASGTSVFRIKPGAAKVV